MSRSTMYRKSAVPSAGGVVSAGKDCPVVSKISRTAKTIPPQTPLLASPTGSTPKPGRSTVKSGSFGKAFAKWKPPALGVNPGTRTDAGPTVEARSFGPAEEVRLRLELLRHDDDDDDDDQDQALGLGAWIAIAVRADGAE